MSWTVASRSTGIGLEPLSQSGRFSFKATGQVGGTRRQILSSAQSWPKIIIDITVFLDVGEGARARSLSSVIEIRLF